MTEPKEGCGWVPICAEATVCHLVTAYDVLDSRISLVVTAGWVVDKDPENHLKTVKSHLEYGRGFLEDIEHVQPYAVPGVQPDASLVSTDAPRRDDPYVSFGPLPSVHGSRA